MKLVTIHPIVTKIMADEVAWYRANGRHPDRIAREQDHGREYVVGDWSWNRMHPDRQEHIERWMHDALSSPEKT